MRRFFVGLAVLLMVAVVLQFFLAASGAFDTAPNDESFQAHRALGYGILLLAVVATLVAVMARVSGRLIGLCGLVAGLVVAQSVIRNIAKALEGDGGGTTTAGKLVFGLHAINGLAIMAVTGVIVRQARQSSKQVAPVRQEP